MGLPVLGEGAERDAGGRMRDSGETAGGRRGRARGSRPESGEQERRGETAS